MQSASNLFTAEQRQQIERAVVQAEAGTSCEIVPVVASASGRYDRAEDLVGLWAAVLTAAAVWWFLPRPTAETGSWSEGPPLVGMAVLIGGMVAAFLGGAVLGSRIAWLRRLFTPRGQMREEVAAKARGVFFDTRVHHTTGATGLLIFVSLFERTAIVLGDQEIMNRLGQSFLDELCAELTTGLRTGSATETLCRVIATAGERLSGPLPRAVGDVNELQDCLVLID